MMATTFKFNRYSTKYIFQSGDTSKRYERIKLIGKSAALTSKNTFEIVKHVNQVDGSYIQIFSNSIQSIAFNQYYVVIKLDLSEDYLKGKNYCGKGQGGGNLKNPNINCPSICSMDFEANQIIEHVGNYC